jgi:uncharacterized repeat protein (TIGR03833 family)
LASAFAGAFLLVPIGYFYAINSFFMNEHTLRRNIQPGLEVQIVLKADQRSGKLTSGIVKDILTNSPSHPHGIKVRLTNGQVGRVQEISA